MSKVDDFIEYFIDKNEVFPDHFLTNLSEKVLDDDDNSVEEFENEGGGHVEPGSGDDVYGGLF